MQIQDLAKEYETKADEELLQLAKHSEQLTPEAHSALRAELARRRIDGPEHSNGREESDQGRTEQPKSGETAFVRDSHGVGEFVAAVLRVYHGELWLFVKLTVPAVVVCYIAVVTARHEVREIARHLPRGYGMLGYQFEILQMLFANSAGYLVSWMASCFSFGAICAAVRQIEAGTVPSVADSVGEVRERLGSFLRLSLLLFFLLLVAIAAAVLLSLGLFWVVHQRQIHLSNFTIQVVSVASVGLAILVFSRFGLAMPAVILDNCKVGQAIFRSDELTEGKWLTLAALLAKSLVGGYIAGMFPFWLTVWIWAYVQLPWWLPTVASLIAVTVVEPTLFIGFALLYLRMSALPCTPSEALAPQLA